MNQKRIADYGVQIGKMKRGKHNKITDVKGVKVGHCTIDTVEHKTGCTVIIPGTENPYINRPVCSSYVINGFGKTTGLVQIEELGELESPIVLTNTLNVGLMQDALIDYMIDKCEEEDLDLKSFNPVVAECNDSYLNNIAERVVKKEHLFSAFKNAEENFAEGDVGAGKGMSCYQLKGGIGSASRLIEYDSKSFTLGVLVLSNHGLLEDLMIKGEKIGEAIKRKETISKEIDNGSIITIVATDVPLDSRQLKRICKRVQNGIARTGSFTSHGSGEIVIAFSTGNFYHKNSGCFQNMKVLHDKHLDSLFQAVVESTEEAILNSMICANPVTGFHGNHRKSLKQFIHTEKNNI
ncbi:MAG: P1 family peptidase [Thermotogota bacterium]|nr:P1 family peptidase [Thermotogota bacterium]